MAGNLADLGSAVVRSDPLPADDLPHHTNPAIPLNPSEFVRDTFVIATHNLEGFITHGLLSFDDLLDGLEQFLDWGQSLLGIDLLDFKIPLIGVSVRDGLNFLESSDSDSVRYLVNQLGSNHAALGAMSSNAAIYLAADALRDILGAIPGIEPIGDADRDGAVETGGDDLLSIDRGTATTALAVSGPTFTDITGTTFKVNNAGAAFAMNGDLHDQPRPERPFAVLPGRWPYWQHTRQRFHRRDVLLLRRPQSRPHGFHRRLHHSRLQLQQKWRHLRRRRPQLRRQGVHL